MDELRPGDPRRIGPYWLEARLGAGGMGRVYLGRSPGGRPVAVKAIRAELAESADFRTRFAREVAAAQRVSGVFTAPVLDADLDGPVPWLATSYVPGPSLADAVAESGPLPTGQVRRLAAGLAEGLTAIHAAGVVHRDLKPSNVILADDGPRVLDFGISWSAEVSALTQTGTVVGSPGFMSPEQAEGGDVGPASDMFSLGAVLAFAATGEGPFGAGSTAALVYRVVYSEPDTARLPAELRPLIGHCLAKDPRHRPTATQLLAELTARPATAGAGPAAVTGPAAARPAPPLPRRPRPARDDQPPPGSGYDPPHPPTEHAVPPSPLPARPTGPAGPAGPVSPPPAPPPAPPAMPPAWPAPEPAAGPRAWPGTGPPAPPGRSGRRWLLTAAAAIALAGAAAGAFLAFRPRAASQHATGSAAGAHAGPLSTNAKRAAPPPTGPPGELVMATLGSYLARSASVRPTVQAAIDGVQTCAQSPASGEATLHRAISTRQQIIDGLGTLAPAGLPHGAQLISELTTAMQDSITADRDYQGWMADVASTGSCAANVSGDPNYAAAQNADVQATAAKNAFVSVWNPMAPGYRQQTYSATGF
jgi:serine/threonine protein kinase